MPAAVALAVPVYFSLPQTKGNAGVLNCPHQAVVMLSLFCASSCCACCTCVLLSPTDQRGAESGAAGKPRGSPQRFSKTSLQCLCLSCEFLPHPSLPSSLPEPLEGPPHFPHHAHHCSLVAFRDAYIIIHLLMFYCRESL